MAKVTKDVTNIHTKQREEEKLEQMLLEGVRSGSGTRIRFKADWARFWKKIDVGIQAKHSKHRS